MEKEKNWDLIIDSSNQNKNYWKDILFLKTCFCILLERF